MMASPAMDPNRLLESCRAGCQREGVSLLAVLADPGLLPAAGLEQMLADGVGDMAFLARHRQLRLQPAALLPGLQRLVVAAWSYPADPEDHGDLLRARYAAGSDYHRPLRKALARIGAALLAEDGRPYPSRACVDSAPLNERSLARLAGLGWIGRNSLLIHPRHGSYVLLGCLLTAAPVARYDGGAGTDRCGSCRRCQEACPTAALVDGRCLSERCIAYLTIEHQGVIAADLARAMGPRWFGCDRCQEVCPWNRDRAATQCDDRLRGGENDATLLAVGPDTFDTVFAGRAIRRLGYARFRRNLLIALANAGHHAACRPLLAEGLPLVLAQARELGMV